MEQENATAQHTPEPWHDNAEQGVVRDSNGEAVAIGHDHDRRRIVACVNACAGLHTLALEEAPVGHIAAELDRLRSSFYADVVKVAREQTRNLVIAAQDFVADVDEMLISVSGEAWLSRQIDGAQGSMTRLQEAVAAAQEAQP
jgi:hypothetical protein